MAPSDPAAHGAPGEFPGHAAIDPLSESGVVSAHAAPWVADLAAAGVRSIIITMVNASGLIMAREIPLARAEHAAWVGVGAPTTFDSFTVDGGTLLGDVVNAVGDRRLRINPETIRLLGDGRAWAPAGLIDPDGTPSATCTRSPLHRMVAELADYGLSARIGHEIEFTLFSDSGLPLAGPWVPHGVTGLLDHQAFLADLRTSLQRAGISLEHLHAEYERGQFEFALPAADPLRAADDAVISRIVLGEVTRRHGLRASVSPMPVAGTVGNGAHVHFSLARGEELLFGGGSGPAGAGPHGLTSEGSAALGGLLEALPHMQSVTCGSMVSGLRLHAELWSGAIACWGVENREASLRLVVAGPASPSGGHVEVRIVDPSANVYLASALILGAALRGIIADVELPPETSEDPSRVPPSEYSKRGLVPLSSSPWTMAVAMRRAPLVREVCGPELTALLLAIRQYEQGNIYSADPASLTSQLRFAWSA